MASYYRRFPTYVSQAERSTKAARAIKKLLKQGGTVAPIEIEGHKITTTFWGKSWCKNLESYQDYSNRLPRGRAYVRNGSVIDLQIAQTKVQAMVIGTSTYDVSIGITAVPKKQWDAICQDCAGGIDSLVELLQGRFSKAVMERLCRQDKGLFPKPSEIQFSCSCPDYASMCKHIAAVLYGIGSRLDKKPELLFHLRAVDENDLVANIDAGLPMAKKAPDADKVLESDDISALFGLDMAEEDTRGPEKAARKQVGKDKKSQPKRKSVARKKAVSPLPKKSKAKLKAAKSSKRKPVLSAHKEKAIWREIKELILKCSSPAYTKATELLLDLRKRSPRGPKRTLFTRHITALRAKHGRKRKFLKQLDAAGLV